ncbi:MAG: MauE/DoxX family redox-associated membrane protein [Chryseobacterium culicis]
METFRKRWVEFTAYFFILLFCYATISKMLDFENFQIQIAQSPLLSSFSGFVSYGILCAELAVCLLLILERTRIIGLYCSLFLMVCFSAYIYLILNYSEFVPCSCGGILEKMGWKTHLLFNLATVILSISSLLMGLYGKSKNYIITCIWIGFVGITGTGIVIGLYLQSEYMMKSENNFTRRFLQHPVNEDKRIDLSYNSYYFAGVTEDSIYLGNYTSPFILTSIDVDMKNTKEMNVKPDTYEFDFKRAQLQVNGSQYYLYDGTVPVIYQGTVGNPNLRTISLKQAYFSQIINLETDIFAFSTYYVPSGIQALGLLSKEKKIQMKPDLLKKYKDGVFDTDGQLHYDQENRKLVYVHYYKNQFLVLDQKLEITRNFKTIDTVSRPQIDVTMLKDGRRKMNKPPFKVNVRSTVRNGLLFNESNLMGRHENREQWQKSSVIDVYSTDKQKYIGSFYIPKSKEIKKIQFEANSHYLFVLIGNEMVRYSFAQNISRHFRKGEAENLTPE